jgi:LacI family gluconate utilization system Gnt-I transcriptional repressor
LNSTPIESARGATLADVARAAGVSGATVSRFFSAPEKLARETRERVQRAVERLGYVPNLLAGGLASNRTRLIAVVVPTIAQSIFSATIQAMTDALSATGYSVMLGLAGARDEHMEEVLLSVLGRRPDGVILTGTVTSAEARARLRAAGSPIIETWDLPDDPIDCVVGFSHQAVGRALAERVVALGRERPLLISAAGRRAGLRRAGFAEVFRERGLAEPDVAMFGGATSFGQGRRALAEHLAGGGRADAIVCTSDWSAHGVLSEAQARGIRVPQDMAVIGFGDLDFAADTLPSLTTVRIDGAAIAREAVRMLLSDEPQARKHIDIGFDVVLRESG